MISFLHNEFKQLGTDYNSLEEVAFYDSRMREFRDIDAENQHIGKLAELSPESEVLEIGTGTGAFARHAAKMCQGVQAIDISDIMLEYASEQANAEGLNNISFSKAGFLSFEYPTEKYDAVVSGLALHHLSDVWKSVALQKINKSLKKNGIFILIDVVFDWKSESPDAYFERILEYAPGSKDNFALHIADELSTMTWVMEGLLNRSGFEIESDTCHNDFLHFYKCRKV
jgi:ubiquinone/menaquinone biosynthesis C-methylase UbiE